MHAWCEAILREVALDGLNPMFANAVQKSEHISAYSVSFVHVSYVGPFPFCRFVSTTISDIIIFLNGRRDASQEDHIQLFLT